MEFLIHQGIKCNKCQKLPIVGIRFKCLQCKSYNLCEDCENKYGKNHGHTLLKLRNNQQINMVLDKYNIKEKTTKLKAKPVEKPSCKCINTSMKFKTANNNNCINIPVKLNNNGNCKWPLPCFFTCEENSLVKGNRVKIWKITGQPGENVEFNIKIDLSKVKRTSEYPSVWSLRDENADKIGNDFKFIINVIFKDKLQLKPLKEEKQETEFKPDETCEWLV